MVLITGLYQVVIQWQQFIKIFTQMEWGILMNRLIYWSSTKEGYFPYVMAFNFESWGFMNFLDHIN